MLTKDDLKAIRKIVREEVEVESEDTKTEIRGEVKMAMFRTHKKIDDLDNRVKNVAIRVKKVDAKLIDFFDHLDHNHVELVKRVIKVERHLNLQTL